MSTLYRKYRPQTFADVFGQEHIKQTIIQEIQKNKIAHAYLFCGPRGVGKTTMARLLAKALNCVSRASDAHEPCNACDACREIMDSRSLDVIEIDAASNTGVEHVREHIINAARFIPTTRKYKVFIIDEVHMLSGAAFNALLKILEEPPSYVIFILATTEIHKILATIISRCQRFDFKKIQPAVLKERLSKLVASEGKSIDEAVYEVVIKNSDGCLRDAESLLGQILILDDKHIDIEKVGLVIPITNYALVDDVLQKIIAGDLSGAIALLSEYMESGVQFDHLLRDMIEYLHMVMLYAIHTSHQGDGGEMAVFFKERIQDLAGRVDVVVLIKSLDILLQTIELLKHSPIKQLPLELACVKISALITGATGQSNSLVATPSTLVIQKTKSVTQSDVFIKQNSSEKQPLSESTDERKSINSEEKKHESEQRSVEASSTQNTSGEFVSLAGVNVQELWNTVKQKLKETNYSLSCVVSTAIVDTNNSGVLRIGFRHKFNADKLNETKNRLVMDSVWRSVAGGFVNFEVFHDPNIQPKFGNDNSVSMGDILKREVVGRSNVGGSIKTEKVEATQGIDAVLDLFGGAVTDG